MTDTETPTALRERYAAAIASYDHAVGQATDPAPGDHHHGQADAVMAVRDSELERLRAVVSRVTETVAALERQAEDFTAHHNPACECEWGHALTEAASRVRAALDPQEQP